MLSFASIAFLSMICAVLEGSRIRLVLVFIPFWIVDGIGILFAALFSLVTCFNRDDAGTKKQKQCFSAALFVLFAMPLLGQAFASMYSDRGDAYSVQIALLVPCLIGAVLAAVTWSCWSVHLWRQSRQHSYLLLYQRRWATSGLQMAMPAGHGVRNALYELAGEMTAVSEEV